MISEQLRNLKTRVANLAARAVIKLIDDSADVQLLQLEVLNGEVLDDCENFQSYGFKSVPLVGAEVAVVFPGGDRGHPLVIAIDDGRHRPKNWAAGESGIFNDQGSVIRLQVNGDIIITPGGGGKVLIDNGAGVRDRLVKKSEFDAHLHPDGFGGTATAAPVTGTDGLEST